MGTGRFRGAAVAALCVATAIVCGCGDGGGGIEPANVAGRWLGTLTLTFPPNSSVPGALELSLAQEEAFVSGIAEWSPNNETLSVTGPVEGTLVTLNLHFRCTDPDTELIRTETTVLAGAVESTVQGAVERTRIVFSGASGRACFRNGDPLEVSGGSGSVIRTTDDRPL